MHSKDLSDNQKIEQRIQKVSFFYIFRASTKKTSPILHLKIEKQDNHIIFNDFHSNYIIFKHKKYEEALEDRLLYIFQIALNSASSDKLGMCTNNNNKEHVGR